MFDWANGERAMAACRAFAVVWLGGVARQRLGACVQAPWAAIGGESAPRQSSEAAARDALAAAKALFDAAGVPCTSEIATGYVGATIVSHAREHGCDGIVMGTRGMGSTEQLLGSIARQVVQLAEMPVTLVK
jgi:nucleotide-binding universal stress UspA family protein